MTHVKNMSEAGLDVSSLTRQWPHYGEDEIEAVARVLRSGRANSWFGTECREFEREFAGYCGATHAIALANGTVALELALRALGIGSGDEVVVTPRSFVASASCASLCGARPVFADVDADSQGITAESIRAVLTPRTRAIVAVHLAGRPCEMTPIMALAEAHDLKVIEDCAQAHGARIGGRMLGAFGGIAAFSTMFGKHHSSGGQGGLVFTRDERLYHAIRRVSDRGKPFFLPPGATNPVASLNFNLTDLAAAIGRVQLRKLPEWIGRRRLIAARLAEEIAGLQTLALPEQLPGAEPSYWFFRLRFVAERAACDKDTYCQALLAEGLPVEPSYQAALPHRMDWFVQRRVFGSSGYPWASPDYTGNAQRQFACPNASAAVEQHFNLRFHENWTNADVEDARAILRKVDAAFAVSDCAAQRSLADDD